MIMRYNTMRKTLAFCSKCSKPYTFKVDDSSNAPSKIQEAELICPECREKESQPLANQKQQ
jgi:DNA-directed RNA polymerase subunit RPC12/RpoP